LRIKSDIGPVTILVDGERAIEVNTSDAWQEFTVVYSVLPEEHNFRIGTLRHNYLIDSITVDNRIWWNIAPFIITGVALLVFLLATVVWAWQRRTLLR